LGEWVPHAQWALSIFSPRHCSLNTRNWRVVAALGCLAAHSLLYSPSIASKKRLTLDYKASCQLTHPRSIMLSLKTEDELKALHSGGVRESLHLEYKASAAIDKKDDKKKLEMARDVSAFANADGGQIIYGMTEADHDPAGLDQGIDPKIYPEIWFEQILQQHVTPPIAGLKPYHVPLANGQVAVVIDIPATKGDPHQADGRFYRRHNFNRLIMEHYEIRDGFRRTTSPDLFVTLSFLEGSRQMVRFPGSDENSTAFSLLAHIENRSPQPASHVIVDIGIDTDFQIVSPGGFRPFESDEQVETTPLNWLRWSVASPPGLPIFKEHPRLVTENAIMLSMHSSSMSNQEVHDLSVRVVAPGCSRQENWSILARGPSLTIHAPSSEYSAER
jgi:Schlafen, AlbA_2